MTNGKPPAPPRVDRYLFWTDPPPIPSPRLRWWLDRIEAGWRPGKRIRVMGYDERAEFYGVYIWESVNVLGPAMHGDEPSYQGQTGALLCHRCYAHDPNPPVAKRGRLGWLCEDCYEDAEKFLDVEDQPSSPASSPAASPSS